MFLPRSLQSTLRSGSPEPSSESLKQLQLAMNRRRFLTGVGAVGAVAGTAMVTGCGSTMKAGAQSTGSTTDTAVQIFTAALIAEDLATTMYYNALIGGVIQDPNLSGTGGSATNVTANGSVANVGYLRGALSEEITHANLLRSVLSISASTGDPVQTFYFPTGTFDNLTNFFPIIIALETAFIAAYMTAVEEFALMLGDVDPYSTTQMSASGSTYAKTDLASFAKICAAILGVEAEHRTLARAIPPPPTFNGVSILPSDNVCYESTDTLQTVYNGMNSAAAALGPFLSSSSGTTAFSLQTALSGAASVQLACSGMPPM